MDIIPKYTFEVRSTTEWDKSYTIRVFVDPPRTYCDCKAGRIIGRCKHMRFYKDLIRDLLRENPGFGGEKDAR